MRGGGLEPKGNRGCKRGIYQGKPPRTATDRHKLCLTRHNFQEEVIGLIGKGFICRRVALPIRFGTTSVMED